jgi:hypothetical protein
MSMSMVRWHTSIACPRTPAPGMARHSFFLFFAANPPDPVSLEAGLADAESISDHGIDDT